MCCFIFDDVLSFIVKFRCCEVDNNERMRKEKAKAKEKDKEKDKSKGKGKGKNTSLEGENCLNLSLLADLRYVILNLNNVLSYHTMCVIAVLLLHVSMRSKYLNSLNFCRSIFQIFACINHKGVLLNGFLIFIFIIVVVIQRSGGDGRRNDACATTLSSSL